MPLKQSFACIETLVLSADEVSVVEVKRAALQITRLVSIRPSEPTRPALDGVFNGYSPKF
jgi:hypothetical protein